MALTIGDNFSYQGAKPLDGRIKYDTLAAMKAMADSTLYDGCLAYCVATDKTYQWKSTNTVDADTGKWREFTSGGEAGGGHTIEDNEGTALTQRDVLQFGGDFEVSDDSEEEKTVVTPHELTAAEFAEIMTPLPGTPDEGVVIDLRGNERVIGKVIESDGTEKVLYEKTITNEVSTASNPTMFVPTSVFGSGVRIRNITGIFYNSDGDTPHGAGNNYFTQGLGGIMYVYTKYNNGATGLCTVRYTKTTT